MFDRPISKGHVRAYPSRAKPASFGAKMEKGVGKGKEGECFQPSSLSPESYVQSRTGGPRRVRKAS
jgi:hypothetical protein